MLPCIPYSNLVELCGLVRRSVDRLLGALGESCVKVAARHEPLVTAGGYGSVSPAASRASPAAGAGPRPAAQTSQGTCSTWLLAWEEAAILELISPSAAPEVSEQSR